MYSVAAISLGPEVERLRETTGHVLAVMRRAIYLESSSGLLAAIVADTECEGPLALRVATFPIVREALGGMEGGSFRTDGVGIEIGGVVRIELLDAQSWVPRLPGVYGSALDREAAGNLLARLVTAQGLREGCAPLAKRWPRMGAGNAFSYPLLRMSHSKLCGFQKVALVGQYTEAAQALAGLLGLGVGLTPSGDDVISGLLAMLVWQARLGANDGNLARVLVNTTRELAPMRTNRISARLLWHAGEGVLYAPAIELGCALLAGDLDAVEEPARRLFSIGSTSGADTAVGMLFGLLLGISMQSTK